MADTLDQSYSSANGADAITDAFGQGWQSMSFTPTASGVCTRIDLEFKVATGSPTGLLYVYLYSDSTGPGTSLGTYSTVNSNTFNGNYSYGVFTLAKESAPAIVNGTRYHIVCHCPGGDGSNYLHTHIKRDGTTEFMYYSGDGITWDEAPPGFSSPFYQWNFKQYYDIYTPPAVTAVNSKILLGGVGG
jgi:hypothetical protein